MTLQQIKVEIHNTQISLDIARQNKKRSPTSANCERVSELLVKLNFLRTEKKALLNGRTAAAAIKPKSKVKKNDFITSIGVELEGGIDMNELAAVRAKFPSCENTTDGSVSVSSKNIRNAELKFHSKNVEEVFDFVRYCFDNGLTQNYTCGNHIHLKVDENIVGLLTTKKFNYELVKYYEERYIGHPKYLERLNCGWARSTYRMNDVIEALNSNYKTNLRYRFVNCNAYPIHGTIELRIMPWMRDGKEYVEAMTGMLNKVVEIIEKLKADSSYSANSLLINKMQIQQNITMRSETLATKI